MTRSSFKPRPEQMALYPEVSGNTINGLGETERRQPAYVYWGNSPDDVAHGDVQRWFYTVDPGLDGYGEERARRAAIIDAPLTPLAETPQAVTEADFDGFSQAGLAAGDFDKIGVADFDPVWARFARARMSSALTSPDAQRIASLGTKSFACRSRACFSSSFATVSGVPEDGRP